MRTVNRQMVCRSISGWRRVDGGYLAEVGKRAPVGQDAGQPGLDEHTVTHTPDPGMVGHWPNPPRNI